MAGTIVLVRHGESEGNATRTFTRSPEVPLTDTGRGQAARAGDWLRDHLEPIRLLSSPFARAWETAQIIGAKVRLEIEPAPSLQEQDLGRLHGQPYDSAALTPGYDDLPRWEWRPPEGETLLEVQERATRFVEGLARHHPEQDVIAVAHHGTITSIWASHAKSWDAPEPVPNCGLLVLTHDGERFAAPELLVVAS